MSDRIMKPLPTPHDGETQEHWMERCMSNPTMNQEFPDAKQRAAVCYRQFRRKTLREVLLSADGISLIKVLMDTRKHIREAIEAAEKRKVYANIETFRDAVANAKDVHVLDEHGNVIEIIRLFIKKMQERLKRK